MISVYLIRKLDHACTQSITDDFHMVVQLYPESGPNLLHICWNAAAKHVCMFVYGHRGPGGNNVMLHSFAAYILLKHELGQQEGNSEPSPYREQFFPGDGGQKEEKHELWDEIQRKDWRGGVEPPREQINYHL